MKNFNFRGSGLHRHLTITEIIHPANNPQRKMAHAIVSIKGVSSDESGSGSVRLPLACCTCSHPTRIARACQTCSLLGPAVLARTLAACWTLTSFSSMSLSPAFCTSSWNLAFWSNLVPRSELLYSWAPTHGQESTIDQLLQPKRLYLQVTNSSNT